jgi:hypothetical protein
MPFASAKKGGLQNIKLCWIDPNRLAFDEKNLQIQIVLEMFRAAFTNASFAPF